MGLLNKLRVLLSKEPEATNSVHSIIIHRLSGEILSLREFRGKKLLIVNVASACGLTPQYKALQELQEKYSDRLVIIGVPCNDFAGQEPGSANEIREFCDVNYGITFPLTEKVNITAEPVHPLYDFLTNKNKNGHSDSTVEWNFQKYLLDGSGHLIAVIPPSVDPLDDSLLRLL